MATEVKPQHSGTKQLFQNPILEKLSRTHIAVPLVIFTAYAAALLYWSITHTSLNAMTSSGFFIIGLLVFTWVEYNVHRYVFHMAAYTIAREKLQDRKSVV